jgi:hypothetical protein
MLSAHRRPLGAWVLGGQFGTTERCWESKRRSTATTARQLAGSILALGRQEAFNLSEEGLWSFDPWEMTSSLHDDQLRVLHALVEMG